MCSHQSQSDYSHNLQDSSLHLSQTRVHSNSSLMILLETVLIKIRKFIREQHLDINIPRSIVIIALIITVYLMIKDNSKDKSNYDLYKDVGTLIGAGTGILFAMTNLHNQYHYNKLEKASHYIEIWHNEQFCQLRQSVSKIIKEEFYEQHPTEFNNKLFNKCHSTLIELKKSPDGVEILKKAQSKILERLKSKIKNDDRDKVETILSFFENMGQDVKLQVADSDYLKDYFYSIVIDTYEFFRKYIEYRQFDRCSRLIFCNFVYLAQTWEKEGALPTLPKICQRPLIITSSDLQKVQEIEEKEVQRQES